MINNYVQLTGSIPKNNLPRTVAMGKFSANSKKQK
jgi:hypothetical protein